MKFVSNLEEYKNIIATGTVIVDFTAEWCGPCKSIAPVFEEYSKKYSSATFIKVDVDQAPDIAQMAGVRAMPTFHVYVNGQKVKEIVGADKIKLEQAIQSVVTA